MPIKRELLYPFFLKCCQHADDIYWENVFEELAFGKTPYGTYISKDFLCCSYKKKEFSYKIEDKDSLKLYNDVYNLFTKKLGLLSEKEKITKHKAFCKAEESIKDSRKCWCDIRKKNTKELLIELYVCKIKNKYMLSIKQARYLLNIIMIAIVLKVITNEDIKYTNGSISKIEGIDFGNKQIFIEKELYNIEVNLTPHIIIEKKIMSENWEKYLKELRKVKS